jgi:predicted nucleic-acid-binding Zn-ribbon protein
VAARVHEHDGFVVLRPENRKLFDMRYSGLIAQTCTKCGLIEFFADTPENLISQ